MTITGISWTDEGYQGRDIHLLPGLAGPRLDQLLHFRGTPGTVTLTFTPSFDAAQAAVGVAVDEHTGVVTVSDPLPTPTVDVPRLSSFIVDVEARDDTAVFHAHIRFHIHEAMTSMWLTPSPLTVRVDTTEVRFSVVALFDDLVIGDITNWAPWGAPATTEEMWVRAAGHNDPIHQWAVTDPDPATHPGISVDNDTGQLTCLNAAATGISVTVRRITDGQSATGLARGGSAWATPVRLAHVMGPGYDAMINPDVKNVLFLPDGFLATERDEYERLVQGIVTAFRFRGQTRPFDVLAKSFNYFTAWVPSSEAGHSVLYEVVRRDVSGTQWTGDVVPNPTEPVGTVPRLSLNGLIWTVGLPLPAYDRPGDPLGDEDSGNLHDWHQLFDAPEASQVPIATYNRWLGLSTRVLLNERDTAFGLCSGERPTVDTIHTPGSIRFHPLRGMRDDLDDFLRALRDEDGNEVADVWSLDSADEAYVVFLCRIKVSSGSNGERVPGHGARYAGVPLFDDPHLPVTESATHGWDLVIEPVPDPMPTDLWATVAHELAHSFSIKDEYGGNGTIPDGEIDGLATSVNVQPRRTLLVNDSLQTTAIKWRWPRITKAGVLAAPVLDAGGIGVGPFTFPLQAGHGAPFAIGDVIRVRTRPLATSTISDRLRVTAVSGDTLTAELFGGNTFVQSRWPAGSVVLVPLRAQDPQAPDVLGDDLLLIAQSTLDRIDATHDPLNMDDGAASDLVTQIELDVPTAATNFPNNLAPVPPPWSSWYVGLFDNGATYDTGVYRPTGICIMSKPDYVDVATKTVRAYQFCPVCRYALVDEVDPTKHGTIDADYAKRYPA